MTNEVSRTAELSGFWRRFGGWLIDGIIVGVVTGIVAAIIAAPRGGKGISVAIEIGVSFLIGAIYYTWGYGSGQTIGCRILNMRIVDQNTGGEPGYGKGFARYLVQYVLGLTTVLGLIDHLWLIWDGKKQTWHDKVAGTLVIDGDVTAPASPRFDVPQ